jgi:hypothetical protein
VLGALRAGARGYLTKDASSQDIRAAILTVAAGTRRRPAKHQHADEDLGDLTATVKMARDTLGRRLPDHHLDGGAMTTLGKRQGVRPGRHRPACAQHEQPVAANPGGVRRPAAG